MNIMKFTNISHTRTEDWIHRDQYWCCCYRV